MRRRDSVAVFGETLRERTMSVWLAGGVGAGVIGTFSRAAHSMVSLLPDTGTHTGGCGCCTGRGQMATSIRPKRPS
jgi:hypothetical protein